MEGGNNPMKKFCMAIWNDESAQGATEYILILAIVVGLAMMFGSQIKTIISAKLGSIGGAISSFTPESGN
jgi:Flp pilus assembly pilin Flp